MRRLVLAALAGLGVLAPPVTGTATTAVSPCGYGQSCSGYAVGTPSPSGAKDIVAACTAVSPYPVGLTFVDCYLRGTRGDVHVVPPVAMTGQLAVAAGSFPASQLPSTSYVLCVGAGYFDGTYHPPVVYFCGPVV